MPKYVFLPAQFVKYYLYICFQDFLLLPDSTAHSTRKKQKSFFFFWYLALSSSFLKFSYQTMLTFIQPYKLKDTNLYLLISKAIFF